MAIDLKTFNHNQLNELIEHAKVRQAELAKEKLGALRERIENIVKQEGYSLEDVFGGRARRARKSVGVVAPKFRNPANAQQTWSGRGKRPRWFHEALAAGRKEADMLIK
ncbi:MAG: H-NS histone family protein [Metallibacterium scheffleri]|jgi:DNA-binding protein H-NS